MNSAGPQRHEYNMEDWRDIINNIDPQLLAQDVSQVGAFMGDEMQADNTHTLETFSAEQDVEEMDFSMDLDVPDDSIDLDASQTSFQDATAATQMGESRGPVTPMQPFHFSNHDQWNTPPSSLRADADVFHPHPSWQASNRFAALDDSMPGTAPQHSTHLFTDRGGFVTPDTVSTGQIAFARGGEILSPTRGGIDQRRTVGAYQNIRPAAPANPVNLNGVSTNTPAVENLHSWVGGAYSVPAVHDATHLAPHTTPQAGRRSRATSVASTPGHGNFVCVGAPGKPCGKRFPTKSAMTHHARCHLPPRHFCSICESGWYYRKDLTRHMKTHTPRDRHLICNNNGCKYHTQPFARPDHLKRHEQSCRFSQQSSAQK